ncbi:hypothetical protein TURU_160187 [Turdus rufiventris]|nr:hypothetical protein TURU_160187 [Turdus rufiventris]
MQTFLKGKRVGYWLSEKKIRKLNFQAFAELCRALRAVGLEDRALGLSSGKPGFKPMADVSQGRPSLKMGQAHSDPLAEPAIVYGEG